MVCEGCGNVPDGGHCLIVCDPRYSFGDAEISGFLTCNAREGRFIDPPVCVGACNLCVICRSFQKHSLQ